MTADRLARFTPAAGPDPADLLFQMGRASAPTRLRWKLAVSGLLLTNALALGWIALRPDPPVPVPEAVTVIVPVPVPVPEAAPLYPQPEPTSIGPFRVRDDPDRWPSAEPVAGIAPPSPPLTPLAARRGELD
ncbi:hypothetical protein J0H58_16985 [bacterium]|nr:hypothetical protein [bacterium]